MENYFSQPRVETNLISNADFAPAILSDHSLEHFSKEAIEIMKLLDEVRNFTSVIRKKLMNEFNHTDPIHLKLDTI